MFEFIFAFWAALIALPVFSLIWCLGFFAFSGYACSKRRTYPFNDFMFADLVLFVVAAIILISWTVVVPEGIGIIGGFVYCLKQINIGMIADYLLIGTVYAIFLESVANVFRARREAVKVKEKFAANRDGTSLISRLKELETWSLVTFNKNEDSGEIKASFNSKLFKWNIIPWIVLWPVNLLSLILEDALRYVKELLLNVVRPTFNKLIQYSFADILKM